MTAALLLWLTPKGDHTEAAKTSITESFIAPYKIIFSNPQSYLCGSISGLLFIPTTVGAMTWGVAFLERDRSLTMGRAATTASLITLGWVVGCPILGWISDRIGRRKLVVMAAMLVMIALLLQVAYLPSLLPLMLSFFLFGAASGSAMIPFSIIKEVNPDKVKASATGAMNFITFGVSALIVPVFGKFGGRDFLGLVTPAAHFRGTLVFWVIGSS